MLSAAFVGQVYDLPTPPSLTERGYARGEPI